ncbi:MAG: 3-deoxy-D-manno-octulosonic acid transferase [Terriglobia bacterium]
MIFAYDVLVILGTLLIAPFYAWRYRKTPFLRKSWRERLGYLPDSVRTANPGGIWVHAVSVGETLAVAGLIERLAAERPERQIFISHLTPTGREAGEKRLPNLAGRFYLPLDLPGPLGRAIRHVRPALLIIAETELWPNLLRVTHRSGARVVFVNARLSDNSLRGYRLFRPFIRRTLENADLILAQTAEDRERFIEIGAKPERTLAVGNLKFDTQPPGKSPVARALSKALPAVSRAPVVVAASTMPGEERLILDAWQSVRRHYPQALLILAPRHPARFDQVARLVSSQGHELLRRTALATEEPNLTMQLASAGILLLDTLGELAAIFELADVVFIGGSLVPTGGHNLLEPAWWGKPVVFGPHMHNFREAARIFLGAGAAVQVQDAGELEREMIALLANGTRARAMGIAARDIMRRESGVTERVLERLLQLLDEAADHRSKGVS